jgi:hypothetical protein
MRDKNCPAHFIVKYKKIQHPKFSMISYDDREYVIYSVKVNRKIKREIESKIINEIPKIGRKRITVFHMENKKNKPFTARIEVGDYTLCDLINFIQIFEEYLRSDNIIRQLLSNR